MLFKKSKTENEILEEYFTRKGYVKNGTFGEKDIFIAGFPKSGNTWMQHILCGMLYGTDMHKIQNNLVRELVPDLHTFQYYKRYNDMMGFKTHHLPKPEYQRVIFLIRDGRDALTSYYHMQKGRQENITFENVVYKNEGLLSSWEEHVNSWLANKYNANILPVRYEDMLGKPFEVLNEIRKRFEIEAEDELLNKIIENCSFANMRKKETSGFWGKSAQWSEGKYFVRKGEAGSFRTDMPQELQQYFNKKNEELLRTLNYAV